MVSTEKLSLRNSSFCASRLKITRRTEAAGARPAVAGRGERRRVAEAGAAGRKRGCVEKDGERGAAGGAVPIGGSDAGEIADGEGREGKLDGALVAGERGIDPPLAFAGAAAIVVKSRLDRIAAFAQHVTAGDFEVEVGLDDLGGVGTGEEIGGLAVIVLGSEFSEDEPGVVGGLVLCHGQAEGVGGAG